MSKEDIEAKIEKCAKGIVFVRVRMLARDAIEEDGPDGQVTYRCPYVTTDVADEVGCRYAVKREGQKYFGCDARNRTT